MVHTEVNASTSAQQQQYLGSLATALEEAVGVHCSVSDLLNDNAARSVSSPLDVMRALFATPFVREEQHLGSLANAHKDVDVDSTPQALPNLGFFGCGDCSSYSLVDSAAAAASHLVFPCLQSSKSKAKEEWLLTRMVA